MRTIAHLSDLHFGTEDSALLPPLASTIRSAKPDVVVISGDLTQRARTREFAAAQRFLRTLPFPQIVVPGNHDVPLYNVFMRTFHPLTRYRRFFGSDMTPFYADSEVAVVGVNTARSLTFKDGRINTTQVRQVCKHFERLESKVIRVVVTHHPFEGTEARGGLVGRAQMAMAGFSKGRVDLVLSGHMHTGRFVLSTTGYEIAGFSALLIQAGTATSMRRRGEANSFNVIEIEGPRVIVSRYSWNSMSAAFQISSTDQFAKTGDQWSSSAFGKSP
jgi:3',5'-cyclic AMP phosphodiesterase CpdA